MYGIEPPPDIINRLVERNMVESPNLRSESRSFNLEFGIHSGTDEVLEIIDEVNDRQGSNSLKSSVNLLSPNKISYEKTTLSAIPSFLPTLTWCGLAKLAWSTQDGVSTENNWTNQLDDPIWKNKVGIGFSSVVVANGRLFTMGHDGDKRKGKAVYCLDPKPVKLSGRTLIRHR